MCTKEFLGIRRELVMANYKISTDANGDLPQEYLVKNDVSVVYLSCLFDGVNYDETNMIESSVFYKEMRAGKLPTTSQVNPDGARRLFEKMLEGTNNILHIAFSSGLSGTYNSMRIAAEELMEEREGIEIIVIDSLCASLGLGLLVNKAVTMRDEGVEMKEAAKWLEEHKLNFLHGFTVDDLNHLYRGGRVSKLSAVIGTVANIKPVLKVNNEGKLVPCGKVRGRRKSLLALVTYMEEHMGDNLDNNKTVFISHGDALEDAEYVANKIKEKFGIEDILINYIGPTIGAHSGPGTVALFFYGNER